MNEKELHKEFYNFAQDFLNKHIPEGVNLNLYMVPAKIKTMNDVYKQLIFSAQNRVMSNNVIGERINGIENLRVVLQDFDVRKVLEKYDNADQIFTEISKEFNFNKDEKKKTREIKKTNIKKVDDKYIENNIKFEKRTLWYQFCFSIYDGAKFLDQFRRWNDFKKFVEMFQADPRALPALPLLISKEVYGFQVALSCDFLKEIGFINFGKPDVHVIEILERCGFSTDETSESRKDYEMMKKITEIAGNAEIDAYRFDKILWLIGSGRYYKDNIKTHSLRKVFINEWNNRNKRVSSR